MQATKVIGTLGILLVLLGNTACGGGGGGGGDNTGGVNTSGSSLSGTTPVPAPDPTTSPDPDPRDNRPPTTGESQIQLTDWDAFEGALPGGDPDGDAVTFEVVGDHRSDNRCLPLPASDHEGQWPGHLPGGR
jgi:hypothetical protein